MVDFVPFPGMASTDNNTQYPANQIMITGGGGTVTASGSMVAVPATNQIGVGTTNPLGPFDVNVSASFRQGFTTQNAAVVSSLVSNGTITTAGFQTSGTAIVNALVSNIFGRFGQNVAVNSTNASTLSNNGAMVVAGGVGIGGNLNIGGTISTFTGALGIGTSAGVGVATTPVSANLYVWGNLVVNNTATTTSGVIFSDGTRQTTASTSTPAYGLPGTVQFAGTGNTFLGDSTNFWWDNSNKRLGIGTGSPQNLISVYGTDWVLFNTRPGNAARQEIIVGNVTTFGAVLGYDPSISQSIGYLRRGDSAATSPAISWAYVSSNYRVGINAITQPQNTMDINGQVAIGNNYSGANIMANTNGLSVQGQVGIGTFTPFTQIDILANNSTSGTPSHVMLRNGTGSQTVTGYQFGGVVLATDRTDNLGNRVWNSSNNSFYYNNDGINTGTAGTANFLNNTTFMRTTGNLVTFPGNVAIGTTSTTGLGQFVVVRPSLKANGQAVWIDATDNSGTIKDNVGMLLNDGSSGASGGNSIIFRQTNGASPRRFAGIWGITNASGAGGYLNFGASNADNDTTGPTAYMVLNAGNGTSGNLAVTGNITATLEITAYFSDLRLKDNIKVITNALDRVMSINGVTYNPNELAEQLTGESRTNLKVGVIAQEVEAVMPQVIKAAPFDITPEGHSRSGDNYKTVQYDKLVPLLIQAIKEQQAKIDDLEARLTFLELDP